MPRVRQRRRRGMKARGESTFSHRHICTWCGGLGAGSLAALGTRGIGRQAGAAVGAVGAEVATEAEPAAKGSGGEVGRGDEEEPWDREEERVCGQAGPDWAEGKGAGFVGRVAP